MVGEDEHESGQLGDEPASKRCSTPNRHSPDRLSIPHRMASAQTSSLGYGRPATHRNPSSSSSTQSVGAGPPPADGTVAVPRRPSSTPSRNPISLRLYKVLASDFDDPSALEALKTVSDYYAAPGELSGPDGVSQQLRQQALAATGGDPSVGSASRARKALREDADERLAQGSRSFLDAFGDVDSVRPLSCGRSAGHESRRAPAGARKLARQGLPA
jgi:hypothetical protein